MYVIIEQCYDVCFKAVFYLYMIQFSANFFCSTQPSILLEWKITPLFHSPPPPHLSHLCLLSPFYNGYVLHVLVLIYVHTTNLMKVYLVVNKQGNYYQSNTHTRQWFIPRVLDTTIVFFVGHCCNWYFKSGGHLLFSLVARKWIVDDICSESTIPLYRVAFFPQNSILSLLLYTYLLLL